MYQVITWVCMLALSQADAKPFILAPGGEAPEIGVVEGIKAGKLVFRNHEFGHQTEMIPIVVKRMDAQNNVVQFKSNAVAIGCNYRFRSRWFRRM